MQSARHQQVGPQNLLGIEIDPYAGQPDLGHVGAAAGPVVAAGHDYPCQLHPSQTEALTCRPS